MSEAGQPGGGSGTATALGAPAESVRRRSGSGADLFTVLVVAAVAGLTAALLSSAAPTNTVAIDAAERFLAVAVVTVAASRARRWTLVWGAALATMGSAFPALLLGGVALGATVFMVETRRRSRLLGSLIGAVIGLLALQLDIPGPTGTEALLGLASTVPLLWSGYRRSTRETRHWIRRGLLVLVAVLAVMVLATAAAAVASVSDLQAAVESTEDGVDLAREGQGDESSAAFAEANDRFAAARSKIGSWWAGASRVLPVYGANLTALQRTVRAGDELTEGATSLVSGAEFEEVQLEGGGVDLAALEDLGPKVRAASSTLEEAGDLLATTDSTWLLPQLRDRLVDLEDRLEETRQSSDAADVAVEGLPTVLGRDGLRRYLFLLGNPAESRDMGGHIGNWAEVVVEDGRLDLVEVGRPLELSTTEPHDNWLEGSYPDHLMSMDPPRYPQNLGATPDLPTSARLAAEMYEHKTGRPVDGVAYADPYTFAAFLELVGPVPVPGLDGFEIDSTNAVDFLTEGQFTMFASEDQAGDALESVIETVFDRLVSTKLPGPQTLADLFGPLVDSGRFQFASLHPEDEAMLDYFGLSGEVPEPDGHDVLGVFNRNSGPSKIDTFLERDVSALIRWDPDSGAVNSIVTVDLTNNAPPGGVNRVVGGNAVGAEPGTNVTDLVVISPFPLETVLVDGVPTAAQPLLEGGLWRHTVRVGVPAGGTTSVNFDLRGDVEPGTNYALRHVGQPLVNPGDVSVTLEPTWGSIEGSGSEENLSMQTVEFTQSGDRTIDWLVKGEP